MHSGFLLEKVFLGQKKQWDIGFQTICYCFYCSFLCFFVAENLRRALTFQVGVV